MSRVAALLLLHTFFAFSEGQSCTSSDFAVLYDGQPYFTVSQANNTCVCNAFQSAAGARFGGAVQAASLAVAGTAAFAGGIGAPSTTTAILGGVSVAQASTFNGAVTFAGGIGPTGSGTTTINNALSVTGVASFNGGATVAAGTSLTSNGPFVAAGAASVGGLASLNGGLSAPNATISGLMSAGKCNCGGLITSTKPGTRFQIASLPAGYTYTGESITIVSTTTTRYRMNFSVLISTGSAAATYYIVLSQSQTSYSRPAGCGMRELYGSGTSWLTLSGEFYCTFPAGTVTLYVILTGSTGISYSIANEWDGYGQITAIPA